MKKITTLYKVNYKNNKRGEITQEINNGNEWVFFEQGVIATRKFDGTSAAIFDSIIHKRYDVKPTKEAFKNHIAGEKWANNDFKEVPLNAIPCQEPDLVTGHWPHWVKCDKNNPNDRYFIEAFDLSLPDGTYELCGEKVGFNAEKIEGHKLIRHGSEVLDIQEPFTFKSLKEYLCDKNNDIEGIVFHSSCKTKMCKLRKSDFGIKR